MKLEEFQLVKLMMKTAEPSSGFHSEHATDKADDTANAGRRQRSVVVNRTAFAEISAYSETGVISKKAPLSQSRVIQMNLLLFGDVNNKLKLVVMMTMMIVKYRVVRLKLLELYWF